jgi:transcriptional regulator with XRE-family HTH domain
MIHKHRRRTLTIEKTPLREARKRARFSIRALAERADVSTATVFMVEDGQRVPQLGTVHKLANALGVDPHTIKEFEQPLADVEKSGQQETAGEDEQFKIRSRELTPTEELEALIESEAAREFGLNPAEEDIMRGLGVRLGLVATLRGLMRYLGREETDRAYHRVFGQTEEEQ